MILDEYLAIESMTAAVVDRAVYRTDCHTSVNLLSQPAMENHDDENRTECSCMRQ